MIRGIRGAITAQNNSKDAILDSTGKLLKEMVQKNDISIDDIASVIFSVTDDLDTAFPAEAARKMGWSATPLLCTREIPVSGSLEKCVRVLIHFNTDKAQKDIMPVYLDGAQSLREDV